MKAATLVINQEAGAAGDGEPQDLQEQLRQAFREEGVEITLTPVAAEDLESTLRELAEDPDLQQPIIMAGGDGSVATAAQALMHSKKPLGILPLGTMNLAARDFGVPLALNKAVKALVEAEPHPIDLLTINGRVCLCNLVLGFYPALALRQEEFHGKFWLFKVWQTLRDTFVSFQKYKPLRVELETDKTRTVQNTRFLTVTSNEYEQLFQLLPQHKTLDAGFMSLYISHHRTFWGILGSSFSFILGRLDAAEDLLNYQTRNLRIDSNRRYLPVMIDGETLRLEPPLDLRIEPQALNVLLPRTEALSGGS